MTTDRDLNRVVRSWLDEGVTALPDRVLDAVLAQVPATPQRRSTWWAAWRFSTMNSPMKFLLAGAAVVVALLVGYNLFGLGANLGSEPTPTSSMTAVPWSEAPSTGLLDPGSYVLDGDFPLAIVFDVPANWSRGEGWDETDYLAAVHLERGDNWPVFAMWGIVSNVYSDPCHRDAGLMTPAVGPTVDDLVEALTGMAWFTSTSPTDVTVDGHHGKRFQISTNIDSAACPPAFVLSLWDSTIGGYTKQVPGPTTMEFWVLDVDGTRLVMFTQANDAYPDEVDQAITVLESTRFE